MNGPGDLSDRETTHAILFMILATVPISVGFEYLFNIRSIWCSLVISFVCALVFAFISMQIYGHKET